jgi:hypothetical protein
MSTILNTLKNTISNLNSTSEKIKLNNYKKHSKTTNTETLLKKWVYSTNHKYIGILYIIFGLLMGIVGATFSLMIRLELLSPGHIFF